MAKVKLTVWGYRCERCDHEWVPRVDHSPRVCPKCKSPYWNVPRKPHYRRSGVSEIEVVQSTFCPKDDRHHITWETFVPPPGVRSLRV